jgi:hypothetical protein
VRLALIDADILVYRIGFASEDSSEAIAKSRMREFVEDLILFNGFDSFEGFISGSSNYRKDIAVTATYKGNRKQPKPKHYNFLREYLLSDWEFKLIEDQEADDAIGIRAYEMDVGEFSICSIDKDLDMIRGNHYNFVKDLFYDITDEEAIFNFYKQVLTGDRVDNIIGIKGIGEVKAKRILEKCTNEKEMYLAVLEAYEGNEERVLENGQLLWIRRLPNQLWQPPSLS